PPTCAPAAPSTTGRPCSEQPAPSGWRGGDGFWLRLVPGMSSGCSAILSNSKMPRAAATAYLVAAPCSVGQGVGDTRSAGGAARREGPGKFRRQRAVILQRSSTRYPAAFLSEQFSPQRRSDVTAWML